MVLRKWQCSYISFFSENVGISESGFLKFLRCFIYEAWYNKVLDTLGAHYSSATGQLCECGLLALTFLSLSVCIGKVRLIKLTLLGVMG